MRVLVLSHSWPTDRNPAHGNFAHAQVAEIARHAEVKVLSPRHVLEFDGDLSADLSGVEILTAGYFAPPGRVSRVPRAWSIYASVLWRLRSLWRRFPFDLIHAHAMFPAAWVAVRVGRRLGVPVVATSHNDFVYFEKPGPTRFWRYVREACEGCARVVAVSRPIRDELIRLGAPPHNVHVIPNGSDPKIFRPRDRDACRRQIGLQLDRPVVLYVGILYSLKGLDFLLDAWAQLLRHRPNAELILVGDGPQRADLMRRASELGISQAVRFAGYQTYDRVATWMGAANLVVLPSVSEGLPTVLAEAAGCGRPVVATSVGGTPEIVQPEVTGLLVPPRDVAALAGALQRALTMPWSEAAIVRHAERFRWPAIAEEIVKLYRELLEEPQPGATTIRGPSEEGRPLQDR